MGMDVYGKNPTAEVGHYFRNNAWWWAGLANFVTSRYPEITAACTYWGTNDGDGLDAASATALADAIDQDFATGVIDQWEAAFNERREAAPRQTCRPCEGTGARNDEGGTTQTCVICEGTGMRAGMESWYHFSVDNVREFSAFLRASGGFEIC